MLNDKEDFIGVKLNMTNISILLPTNNANFQQILKQNNLVFIDTTSLIETCSTKITIKGKMRNYTNKYNNTLKLNIINIYNQHNIHILDVCTAHPTNANSLTIQ